MPSNRVQLAPRHSQVAIAPVKIEHPELELSLSQLLDAIERRLDSITGITRYCGALPSISHDCLIANLPLDSRTDATVLNEVRTTS
jgi:hypothetical protein